MWSMVQNTMPPDCRHRDKSSFSACAFLTRLEVIKLCSISDSSMLFGWSSCLSQSLTKCLITSATDLYLGTWLKKQPYDIGRNCILSTLLYTHTVRWKSNVLLMKIRLLNWIVSSVGPCRVARMLRLIWDCVDSKCRRVPLLNRRPKSSYTP